MPKAKSSSGDWSRTHPYLRGIREVEQTRDARIKRVRSHHKGEHIEVKLYRAGVLVYHCKHGKQLT
jgi:hypothetical protein